MTSWTRKKLTITRAAMLVAMLAGLTACSSKQPVKESAAVPLARPAKPALPELRTQAILELQKYNVQVIMLGETIRVVILDDYLFQPGSANIYKDYNHVLKTVTQLLNSYDLADVKVSGYLDNRLPDAVAESLSTRQAQVVADKLRYYGINTRLLYAVGYGVANPVDWNGSEKGRNLNRRVEISVSYYPKIKGYN